NASHYLTGTHTVTVTIAPDAPASSIHLVPDARQGFPPEAPGPWVCMTGYGRAEQYNWSVVAPFRVVTDELSFNRTPPDTTAGKTLDPVEVDVKDFQGALDAGFQGNITLTLSGGDPKAKLGGKVTRPVRGGKATFNDL